MDKGTSIKYEEFVRLPDGCIASGILSDSIDGINIDNSGKLLHYVVVKYSNQDWAVFCLRRETVLGMRNREAIKFITDTGIKVQEPHHIRRAFNCSKKVMDLYTN